MTQHPRAHHHALVLVRRELADHRVAHRRDQQFADALQHVADEDPDERRASRGRVGQRDAQRQRQEAERPSATARWRTAWARRCASRARAGARTAPASSGPPDDDDDGVDVLHPLRLDRRCPSTLRVDVAVEEQLQAARRHLVQRPEHERAERQDQVGPHVAALAAHRDGCSVSQTERREHDRADHLDDASRWSRGAAAATRPRGTRPTRIATPAAKRARNCAASASSSGVSRSASTRQ